MRERGDGRSRLQGATEKVVMVVVMVGGGGGESDAGEGLQSTDCRGDK